MAGMHDKITFTGFCLLEPLYYSFYNPRIEPVWP
jgi:hypothetical protein